MAKDADDKRTTVLIEGLTAEELLSLPGEDLDALVFCGDPIAFRVGSAEVLGHFRRRSDTLVVELAQIDGGGEGVIPALSRVTRRYAATRGFRRIDWLVHAVSCANPNPKLRGFLERQGFEVEDLDGVGSVYRLKTEVASATEVPTRHTGRKAKT